MNRRLALAVMAVAAAGVGVAGEGQSTEVPTPALGGHEIPPHPRQLQFQPSSWSPPRSADSRFDLAGGVNGFLVGDATLPLVDIVVVARAGADRETSDQRGLAQLTAALLRRGGTRDLEPAAFDDRADELGVIMHSQSTPLYGAATLRTTSEALEEGVELLLDMIERPRFDPTRLASIKRNMAEGMTRRNLDPTAVLDREWDWLLYGETHFSTQPLRPSDLERSTSAAVTEFHRRHWRPENLTFAVSGDVDRERLARLVNPRLEAWASRLAAAERFSWPPEPPTGQPRAGLFHVAADIPQAKVALGHRAPPDLPTDEERVRLEVLAEILGGRGAISRLNGRLRSAEGLVYGVELRLDPGDLWPADYRVAFDTLGRNTCLAMSAALEEIERIRSAPPHPEELAVVKRELLARQFQAFDTAEEAVGYLVQDWLVGRSPDYRRRYGALLEQVTPQDVLATARLNLWPEDLTVLIVGPWESSRGNLDAAGVSELERIVGHRVEALPKRDPSTLQPSN